MFLAWLMCISFFIASYYVTMVIFANLKEKDQQDLALLDSQLTQLTKNNNNSLKQAV